MGNTTMIETVMRIDVDVCCVARFCTFSDVPPWLLITRDARELAWLMYWYRRYCKEYNF